MSLPSSSSTINHLAELYEHDYHLWLETTAKLLQDRQLLALDITHLLEEIEDMGRSEKRAVYSNLKILLVHLLKYQCQPEKRSTSWTVSIVEHRQRLKRALQESPSLQPYFAEILNECYQDARELAGAETGLPLTQFPNNLPFALEEILNSESLT